MTTLAERKTIIRTETSAYFRNRALIIELRPHTILIREKGRRKGFEVDYESIFSLGCKKAADAARAEKKAAQKARKRG